MTSLRSARFLRAFAGLRQKLGETADLLCDYAHEDAAIRAPARRARRAAERPAAPRDSA